MQKTVLKISEIKNNPNNPRLIKDDKFKKLVKSIQEFPEMLDAREVVVNKDHIILGGNMRFKAAKEAGIKEIPVKIVDWGEDKQSQFVIKDNVSGGEWDWDQLANEWEADELDSWGLDVPADWGEEKEIEEDEAPEVDESEPPKSKLGEIYQLGRHRVMCGDSTDLEQVSALMNGKTSELLLTDPPYGIGADTHAGKKENGWTQYESSGWDKQRPSDEWFELGKRFTTNQIVWGGNYFTDILPISQCWLVWDKGQRDFSLADGELAWTSYDKALRIKTVARATALKDGKVHPTQKSIDIMTWCLTEIADKSSTVLDLFLGSGSTLIACEQTDRTCFGMELSESYTDVVRKRWAKYVYPDRWEEEWEQLTPVIET